MGTAKEHIKMSSVPVVIRNLIKTIIKTQFIPTAMARLYRQMIRKCDENRQQAAIFIHYFGECNMAQSDLKIVWLLA